MELRENLRKIDASTTTQEHTHVSPRFAGKNTPNKQYGPSDSDSDRRDILPRIPV
jgi:hypothetical protein